MFSCLQHRCQLATWLQDYRAQMKIEADVTLKKRCVVCVRFLSSQSQFC